MSKETTPGSVVVPLLIVFMVGVKEGMVVAEGSMMGPPPTRSPAAYTATAATPATTKMASFTEATTITHPQSKDPWSRYR